MQKRSDYGKSKRTLRSGLFIEIILGGSPYEFKEQHLLITGGSNGIGLAMAERFLQNGNEVIICGRREEKLASAKESFPQKTQYMKNEKMMAWFLSYRG